LTLRICERREHTGTTAFVGFVGIFTSVDVEDYVSTHLLYSENLSTSLHSRRLAERIVTMKREISRLTGSLAHSTPVQDELTDEPRVRKTQVHLRHSSLSKINHVQDTFH